MTRFFIQLYHYFQKHRFVLFLLLILSFVLFLYYGLKLSYEEDISKLLPSTDHTKAEGIVFSELKVRDRIFVQILSKNGAFDPDILSEVSDIFVDSLLSYDAVDGDVGDILYKMDEEITQNLLTYAIENAPTLLDSVYYQTIDSLISKENIYSQMATNYEKIASPEGFVFRRLISNDPINLRSAFLPKEGANIGSMMGTGMTVYGNHLFSPDTTVVFILISPNFVSFDSKACIRLINKAERVIAQLKLDYPDIEVMFHGPPVQSVFNSRQIKQDLALTMGISLFFACLLIVVCYRNKTTLPMLLLPVVFGAFSALACMFLWQDIMSLMALGIGAVVLGVALSYCLHVITHFKYLTDPVLVLKDQVRPVILGSLTTIGAFMGLMFTQSALLRDFGLFASLAMVGTTIACLFFLPHIFPLVRNRRYDKAFSALEKINAYPLDRQGWLLALILVVFVISVFKASDIKFDTNLRNIGYFDPIVTRSMDLYAEKTSKGLTVSYYAATSETLDEAFICNRVVNRVCDSLQTTGLISDYSKSSIILLPEAEQHLRIAAWKNYWTEERIEEVRRHVITAGQANKFKPAMFDPFFDMLTKDYEPSSLYTAQVMPEGLMANMVEHSQGLYIVYTSVQLEKENMKTVNDVLAAHQGVIVVDPYYYTTNMVELMHKDFNMILGVSSIFVFIVLFISFRCFLLAFIAFLPMGMSWYITLGVMAIFGLQFNLINIVISSFIFGVGVDYSIFVMEGLLVEIRGGDKKLLTYHKTAIFLSAVVLIISISSLMFAKHPALSSIGVATLIGMTSTILIAYSLQPFLYKYLMKTKYRKIVEKRFRTSQRNPV